MDKTTNYKIALVLYTSGLDYDDRIRKEMLTIQRLYPNVAFKIFAVEPSNREEEGVTSYGVPYRIPFLKSREKYPSGKRTFSKALEFYRIVKKELKSFDALWCADIETFLFVLFSNGMPILWDHHELPASFMGKSYMRFLYKYMERKCKVVIHANQSRLDYMNKEGLVSQIDKHFVLRNYPDFNEIDSEYDTTYQSFVQWLGESKCVYLQGLSGEARADKESIEAVLEIPELKAVVVGSTRPTLKDVLLSNHTEQELADRVYFAGRIKQLKTPQYIRKCILSLVFYKKKNMNNWYCEPNRLFQNINNGNPVVVGNNPPMKELIDKYGVGVCADTDGSDQGRIVLAMNKVINDMDTYKSNIKNNEGEWLWASQDVTVSRIVEKLL